MNKLFNIKEEDISLLVRQTIRATESEVLNALSVAINSVPSISKNVCMYIDQICIHQPALKKQILEIIVKNTGDHIEIMSRRIYGEHLGIKVEPQLVKSISKIFSEESNENNYLINTEIPDIFKDLIKNTNFLDIFYCYSTIQKFSFNKNECRYRLCAYDEKYIIESMLIMETTSDIAMIIELCKFEKFFTILYNNLSRFRRRLEIISLIFTVYYHDQHILGTIYNSDSFHIFKDRREIMLELLRETDVIDYIYKFGSPENLGNFIGRDLRDDILPSITFKDFISMDTTNLTDFFNAFLLLTSVSPTHFFSYLEFYKDRLINLSEESQREFFLMIKEFYCNHKAIFLILKDKLFKFGIIKVEC